MVGIVTVWSALRSARNEAKKAADLLQEFREGALEQLKDKVTKLTQEIEILKVKYNQRIAGIERSLSRMEQFEWGRDAKSEPFYLRDKDEPQEHKDKSEEGLFRD
jgi:uncharacterized membrane protein YccC